MKALARVMDTIRLFFILKIENIAVWKERI